MTAAARNRLLAACSIASLVIVLAARIAGPSDAWDQTQPRAIAYTTDILVNGRWILPVELETYKATKPPLYHWLAVPAVAVMGLTSEFAHKAPSVAAVVLCWLALVRWGPRYVSRDGDPALGWLAGMMFVVGYTTFKLGYLARPDMLLALWSFAGWMFATIVIVDAAGPAGMPPARRRRLAAGFWICVGLGGLTKGPAVLPVVIYALLAAPLIGRWRAINALEWWWGLPVALLLGGWWLAAVWWIDPQHVTEQLWANEIAGRLTGQGPEGSRKGPVHIITTAPNMVFYYVGRFFPWSIPSILGIVHLWERDRDTGARRWRALGPRGGVLHGAVLFVIVTIVFFTLSASKRADYIAACYAPGALLAAWWLLEVPPRLAVRLPWLAPACAAITLGLLVLYNELETAAPRRGFGRALSAFIRAADRHITAEPAPLAFWRPGGTHVESLLGSTRMSWRGRKRIDELAESGGPFWIVVGCRGVDPAVLEARLESRPIELSVTEAARTPAFPRSHVWPGRFVLFRAEPAGG